jgi:A/G-specific adenine glycosylase
MPLAAAALFGPPRRDWYADHGRHGLPWRLTRDPYAVLVSEVMLQQTQVSRVLPAYEAWLARWPSVAELATAARDEVIRAWAGMGYNRRAVHLHEAARTVVERHGGRVPVAPVALRALPGIGPYTAAAVASFAGELAVVVVDTNVGRVLARALQGASSFRDAGMRTVIAAAEALLPGDGVAARDHNLALMDLGATVCRARGPDCRACPLADGCAWRRAGAPAAAPRNGPAERFEDTSRFVRGRLLARLREGPATLEELLATLPERHRSRAGERLQGLVRDGLAVRAGPASWALPTNAGNYGNSSMASPNE